MEENGRFNEYRNYSRKINGMFQMALKELNDKKERMILFVPLKCERYLKDRKMEDVRLETLKAYDELIHYIGQNFENYKLAVTPIFTLGGAEFSHFEKDRQTGEIKINEVFHTPEKAIYWFPDSTVKEAKPKYCEQPVVYLLSYLLNMAEKEKGKKFQNANILGKFSIKLLQRFFGATSEEDYREQKNIIEKRVKTNGDGYGIVKTQVE